MRVPCCQTIDNKDGNDEEQNRMSGRTCPCGSGLPSSEVRDARGIFLTLVCNDCSHRRALQIRPEVLADPTRTLRSQPVRAVSMEAHDLDVRMKLVQIELRLAQVDLKITQHQQLHAQAETARAEEDERPPAASGLAPWMLAIGGVATGAALFAGAMAFARFIQPF